MMSIENRELRAIANHLSVRSGTKATSAALALLTGLLACAPLPVTPPVTPRPITVSDVSSSAPHRVQLDTTPVCHSCFWNHQDPGFRDEYVEVVRQRQSADPLVAAELRLLVARAAADSAGVCAAADAFATVAGAEEQVARRLLAEESVAFTAALCGRDPRPAFLAAAATARSTGLAEKATIYDAIAADTLRPLLKRDVAARQLRPPAGTTAYVLGSSTIRVDSATTVVSQIERVARDWLSYQLAWDFTAPLAAERVLDYHEGARLRDLIATSGARLLPSSGTLAVQSGGRWYAADGEGVFRFEVLPDKVQYPTTRAWRGVALLVDTHGISSLVGAALLQRADLVVGCGDYTGKMDAAAYLATRGIDVYFPTDRFVAELLGYEGPGTLIGSAPVRAADGGAIIGDRPVTFDVSELLVAQRTAGTGELQYYDAPGRYFQRLATSLPLRLEYVDVDGAGQADRVIARARELGARAVALRVWTDPDYTAVRTWLAESAEHRAVLFHSVAYPAGNRIFTEFPAQSTFGDPRPVFLTESR